MPTEYKAVEMVQKVDITAFDESKTPASVPPEYARNKMKKAFGQVPNTSYYELGKFANSKGKWTSLSILRPWNFQASLNGQKRKQHQDTSR